MGLFGKKKETEAAAPERGTQPGNTGILVLGSGCAKCNALEEVVRAALTELGMDPAVGHVTDFTQIAALFTMVAAIEKDHEERYKALAANIEAGKVYARETEQVWQCRNCGYTYIGQHAPLKCPVCAHPQSYFELKSKNY